MITMFLLFIILALLLLIFTQTGRELMSYLWAGFLYLLYIVFTVIVSALPIIVAILVIGLLFGLI